MNIICIAFLFAFASCSIASSVNGQNCKLITQLSGEIKSNYSNYYDDECWFIEVPANAYVMIELLEFNLDGWPCGFSAYIELYVYGVNETYKICTGDNYLKRKTALNDVIITSHHRSGTSFRLRFTIGISSIKGTKESRTKAINWLMNHQKNHGWGRNTHRAVTALYLTNASNFLGQDAQEETTVNQLQLKTASSLLRNLTEPMSINELSMYINSLLVTCHDVRNIFSKDLLKILANRVFSTSPVSPGAYLTLCNANWQFSESNVRQLLNILTKDINYPFAFEIQAMTIMALTCLNQKTSLLYNMNNTLLTYNETIRNFMVNQKKDGSFGNAHTTALVSQALISSGQIENRQWNAVDATFSLMKSLNTSSVDFLTVYLTLPLLRGKTLVDIGNGHCLGYKRKLEDDEDILDVADKLGEKIHVQYSLHIGDNKNIINNLYLKVPENSTAYDVMRIAQIADPKYKFSYHESNGHLYIYEIAGLNNDVEAGKAWLLYIVSRNDTKLNHFTQSPDQITMEDKDHLIMWYKYARV